MTTFQLLLLVIAGGVFYLFFKQLFSGNHPKRGVDFEAKVQDDQIGGINRPDKIFSSSTVAADTFGTAYFLWQMRQWQKKILKKQKKHWVQHLFSMTVIRKYFRRMGYVQVQMKEYGEARESL